MTPEHAPSFGRDAPTRLNPAALPPPEAARVLTRLGGKSVTEDMLLLDIDAGAPTNGDGSINLVHYAAWLVGEMQAGRAGGD